MKIKYNIFIPIPGFSAMMLFGVIFARKSARPLTERTIRHESIHEAQAKECGGYILFYLKYLAFWMRCGYRNIPFEREAYANDSYPDYLDKRPSKAWKAYKKQ